MNHSVRHLYRYRAALAAKKIVDLDEDFATLLCTVLRLLQAKVGKKTLQTLFPAEISFTGRRVIVGQMSYSVSHTWQHYAYCLEQTF